jgi:uncharacterized protein
MFVGRKKELEKLNRLYVTEKQKFVAVYGRRRIGKSVLLDEFIKDKEGIKFVAFRGDRNLLFKSLCEIVSSFFAPMGPQYAFSDLDELFSFVFTKSTERQFVFIIDEYAYLAEFFPEASSLLQKYIDLYKEKGKLFLVLCSSSRSFMEQQVLGSTSPLYGRRDLSLKIGPFGIPETKEMLPLLTDNKEIFKVWAITGGVPLYLSLFSPYDDVDQAVRELFFDDTGFFVNEVPLMFLMENKSAKNYLSVCTLLACGTNKVSEMANKAGLSSSLISSVLESLSNIDIVEKEESVSPASRRPIWRIKDNLVSFYYRFRYPLSSYSEEQMMMNYMNHINEFLGFSFEKLCASALPKIVDEKFITELGRWWGGNPTTKKEEEIDIVAWTDERELIACECKYISKDISIDTINTLKRRAALISEGEKVTYIFFTKERTALNINSYPSCSFYSLEDVFSLLIKG